MELASEEFTNPLSNTAVIGMKWAPYGNSGQLYVAHECGVGDVSLATLKVVRTKSGGRGECLMSHTVASHTHSRFS